MESLNVSVLNSFPAVDEARINALLAEEIARDNTKLVVLDDDPTGVQTVHDVSVYTDWTIGSIRAGGMPVPARRKAASALSPQSSRSRSAPVTSIPPTPEA